MSVIGNIEELEWNGVHEMIMQIPKHGTVDETLPAYSLLCTAVDNSLEVSVDCSIVGAVLGRHGK